MFSVTALIAIVASGLITKAGSYVGEKICDKLTDATLGQFFGFCKDKLKIMWSAGELPKNANLLKAVIEAKLYAAAYMCKAVENALQTQGGHETAIKQLRELFGKWHKEQTRDLDKVASLSHEDPVYSQIQSLLAASENDSTLALRNKLMQYAKEAFLTDIRTGMGWDGPAQLEEMLMNGWVEDGKKLDWFDIMTLQFGEILKGKKHPRAKQAFEARLLSDIKIDTQTILIKAGEIELQLEANTADIKAHIDSLRDDVNSWLNDIYILLIEFKKNTDIIPDIKQDTTFLIERSDSIFEFAKNGLGLVGAQLSNKTILDSQYYDIIEKHLKVQNEYLKDIKEILEKAFKNK